MKKMLPQNSVLSYKTDLYFPQHKLAIEVDEKGHIDRDEEKRQKDKKQQKNNLVVNLLELILIKRILIFMLKLVKYTITSMNKIKN